MSAAEPGDPFYRPLAKAITIGHMLDEIIYWLEERNSEHLERPVTNENLATWYPARIALAELMIPHLDAYDQRV